MAFPYSNANMFPSNHKTVFVLDHTPYFGISTEALIEFDFMKSRTPGFMHTKAISKSLWTCSLEAAIEYCRIVWDLFPQGKMVKLIASDRAAHILNNFVPSQQNSNHIMNGLSLLGVPPKPSNIDYSVIYGLRAAVESLNEITDLQREKKENIGQSDTPLKFQNRGRIICITSTRDNASMSRLEEIVHNVLMQRNKVAAEDDRLLKIDHCHLVIINTFPVTLESPIHPHALEHVSSLLSTEVHSIKAPSISNKLSSLILSHYNLASTTVTGIPMKEEQNASSSANYDVEIYHASSAHTAVLKGNASESAVVRTVKEGVEYETVMLKWCTPRSCSAFEMQNCTTMHRITPEDVNSRPSLCLTNFILNGRSVTLEMAKKSGGKITSHLLAAHGGEIFIHTLCTARSVLEDPPSISEGCGGRVTDYRIPDFCLFIKQNRLFPLKNATFKETPISSMKERLDRHTKYWPLTISSTYVFNLKGYVEPLTTTITKEKLTDEEVLQCKQVIFNLIALEAKHEPLHLPNLGQRTKGQKREEQYKIMWNELEMLIKNNLHTENHRAVYACLLEVHKFNVDDKITEKMEIDTLEQLDSDHPRASVIRATTDSPMSPPPLASIAAPLAKTTSRSASGIYGTPRSLLDIYTAQDKTKRRPDFCGRKGDNLKVKLYPNLKEEGSRSAKGDGMVVE